MTDQTRTRTHHSLPHREASSRIPQSLRPLDIPCAGPLAKEGSVEGTFCFILEELANGGMRPSEGTGPPSSNLILQLAHPVLTFSVERDWHRPKRGSIIHKSLQLVISLPSPLAETSGAFPFNPVENPTDIDTSENAPQFNGQCQESPIICSLRSASWSLLASSADLQTLAKTHPPFPSLCRTISEHGNSFRGVIHRSFSRLAFHPAKKPLRGS